MSTGSFETISLPPSLVAAAIKAMIATEVSLFLWGPPGCAKSRVSLQVANDLGVAFIDIRLSQLDPSDLRGIPYPVTENGMTGIRWSPPLVLPRDLDIEANREIRYTEDTATVNFALSNPLGKNKIRYIRAPKFSVKSLTIGAVAKITSFSQTHVEAALYKSGSDGQATDETVTGAVKFHITGEAHAIVACEEFNSAPQSVAAAAYEFILDRRLGEYIVPKGCYLMAMGNRDTDKGITFKLGSALTNRFVHIEIMTGISIYDDWSRWALTSKDQDGGWIHPEVFGYITAFKGDLFNFDPNSASRGWRSPRSWEFVSHILWANPYLPEEVMQALVIGAVGEGAGASFMAFRKIASGLPAAEDILTGKLQQMHGETELQLAYALTTTLCYELKERSDKVKRQHGDKWKASPDRKVWLEQADNFIRFIMNNFSPEICVMGARAAIAIHKLPFDVSKQNSFDLFAKKFKSLIVQ